MGSRVGREMVEGEEAEGGMLDSGWIWDGNVAVRLWCEGCGVVVVVVGNTCIVEMVGVSVVVEMLDSCSEADGMRLIAACIDLRDGVSHAPTVLSVKMAVSLEGGDAEIGDKSG